MIVFKSLRTFKIHTLPQFPRQPNTSACCKLHNTEQCQNVVEMAFLRAFEETKYHGIHIKLRQLLKNNSHKYFLSILLFVNYVFLHYCKISYQNVISIQLFLSLGQFMLIYVETDSEGEHSKILPFHNP